LPEKKKDQSDKFGNIVQAKQEMGMTKDQREEAKKIFVAQIMKNLGDLTSLGGSELKVIEIGHDKRVISFSSFREKSKKCIQEFVNWRRKNMTWRNGYKLRNMMRVSIKNNVIIYFM